MTAYSSDWPGKETAMKKVVAMLASPSRAGPKVD